LHFAFCTLGFLLASFSLSAFAASSTDYYVQDGLVTHWDAINNTGTGTHNSSATTWKNLVPGGMDLTIVDAEWEDGKSLCNKPGDNNHFFAAYGSSTFSDYVTSEFAISNITKSSQACVFASGRWGRYCILDYGRTGFVANTNSINSFGCDTVGYHTLTWDSSTNEGYKDGVFQATPGSSTSYGATGGNGYANKVTLGCDTGGTWGKPFNGKYYAIRLYNRALEPDEVSWNALVDRIRFIGGEAGYRDTGTDIQSLLAVVNAANGTVTVNGDVLSGDLEAWDNCDGETVDYAISVSPAEGYMFMGWTGDIDKIASSSDNMRSIVVKHGKEPISLTPLFAAIPVPAMAAPVHVITVNSGETTLTTAVDDGDNTIGTSGTIVKKGAGTLKIASDVISTFAGEIVIEAGCWSASVRSGLGTQDGGDVWVKDGATLKMYSEELIARNATDKQITRRVYISGLGISGQGALYGTSAATGDNYNIFPRNVVLLGDATVRSDQKVNFDFTKVELNRHTLTLNPYGANWDYLDGDITNGCIVVSNKTVALDYALYLRGGAENVVRFLKGSGFRTGTEYGQNKGSSQGRWTAVFEDGTVFYGPNSKGFGWNGPIVLNGHTALTSQGVGVTNSLWGPVSGIGDIGYNTDVNNQKMTFLRLANANNSFTGGVYLKKNVLEATVDGAIPANGSALNSDGSTVYLTAASEYHLPDFVISGTGSVHSASATTGSFKAATKGGDGTYEWDTKVGAKSFALNGGVLKFGGNAATDGAVVANFGSLSSVSNATFDLNGYALTCTNFTGTGKIKDGAFTLNGPWCATPAAGPLACSGTGTLSFGENAVVSLANSASLKRARAYVLATSTETITSLPELDSDAKDKLWALVLSADGRSVILENRSGFTVIVY